LNRQVLFLIGALLGLGTSHAVSHEFSGAVVRVVDGDTIHVHAPHGIEKVRLLGIDAPERYQPFYIESRGTLRSLCPDGNVATVSWKERDKDRRVLGRVRCGGLDVNAEMVRLGAAWVFTRYAPRNSYLYPMQAKARADRVGLWFESNPLPPWEWRRLRQST
jgi:micrococcal nuclease